MVYSKLSNSKITGISVAIPKKELVVTEGKNLYNGDERKIKRLINSSGFYKRRVVENDTTASDLCFVAAKNLIEGMKVDVKSIDGLIYIGYTPDYLMPATSYVLHKRLELSENCIVMDIPQACSGYIIGLYQASMLLNSGCKKVLLLVGDTFSKFSDMFSETEPEVFGDAGTATLLEFDNDVEPMYFNINSCGEFHEALICKNGGFKNPTNKNHFDENGNYRYESKMDGKAIFDFTMEKIAPSIKDLINYAQEDITTFDNIVLHQANKFIMQNIVNQIGYDEARVPMTTLSKYGNQCGASIPATICDNLNEVVKNKKSKMLFCGFGVGLSWASVILNVNKIYCSEIIEF